MRGYVRLVIGALICAFGIVRVGEAHAQSASAFRPEVAEVLEELSKRDRDLLAAVASIPEPVTKCKPRDCRFLEALGDDDWEPRLRAIVGRLASQGGWKAAALANLVPPHLVSYDQDRRSVRASMKLLLESLRKKDPNDECQKAREELALNARANARRSASRAALSRPILTSSLGLYDDFRPGGTPTCLSRALSNDESARSILQYYLIVAVVLPAQSVETIGEPLFHVVSMSNVPDIIAVTKEDSLEIEGVRVALVPLRIQAVATFRVPGVGVRTLSGVGSTVLPNIQTRIVTESRPLYIGPQETRCLEVNASPEKDKYRKVLFDGETIDSSTIAVRDGATDEPTEHVVQVLRVSSNGEPPRLLASRSVATRDLKAEGCTDIRMDLEPLDEHKVDLITASADASCLAAGVDSARVRSRLEQLLRLSFHRELRDSKGYADTAASFSHLYEQIALLGGRATGASRERLGVRNLLGAGGEEALRQGAGVVLLVNVSCAEVDRKWEFTTRASAVSVKKLDQRRDDVAGLDLRGIVQNAVEVTVGATTMEDVIAAPVARVLGEAYLHFEPAPTERHFTARTSERVRVFVPTEGVVGADSSGEALDDYTLSLSARLFESDEDAYNICTELENSQRLRTNVQSLDFERHGRRVDDGVIQVIHARPGQEGAWEVVWTPRAPGRYLVRTQLRRQGDELIRGDTTRFRCVDVHGDRFRLSLDAMYGVNALSFGRASPDAIRYVRFAVGIQRAIDLRGSANVGFSVGYADAIHSRNVAPSWDLSPSSTYQRDGQQNLEWARRSVQVGPSFSYYINAPLCVVESISCRPIFRAFSLFGKLTPVADIGWFDRGSLPALQTFSRNGGGIDVKISTFVEGGAHVQVSSDTSFYALVNFGFIAWPNVVFGANRRAAQNQITYESNMLLGATLGAEYDL